MTIFTVILTYMFIGLINAAVVVYIRARFNLSSSYDDLVELLEFTLFPLAWIVYLFKGFLYSVAYLLNFIDNKGEEHRIKAKEKADQERINSQLRQEALQRGVDPDTVTGRLSPVEVDDSYGRLTLATNTREGSDTYVKKSKAKKSKVQNR